jgi:actin-related protein
MSQIEEKLKNMEVRFDQEEFVVIDNGSGYIKAGFSGQDLPRIVIPTVIGEHTEFIDPSQQTASGD